MLDHGLAESFRGLLRHSYFLVEPLQQSLTASSAFDNVDMLSVYGVVRAVKTSGILFVTASAESENPKNKIGPWLWRFSES